MTSKVEIKERIKQRLQLLYGADVAKTLNRRIEGVIRTHKQLRKRVFAGPHWTHEDLMLITYGDSIQSPSHTPLQTLNQFLDQYLPDAFSMVHLLPFYPWSSDDGFSVTDFRAVNPELGSWKDILELGNSVDLVFDLVLNHASRENLWFIDFIAGDKPACDYFIDLDPATNLSQVTRPRATPVLSGVRTRRGMRYVWTTFSNDQIDLNYQNPDVLIEFIDIMLYYIRRGARMLRLDAVAYLWKELGTNCIHLPQTHEVIKLFRDILDLEEPSVLLMTETNVPHAENISYFGNGDEAHLVYQFSLPPLLLHALFSGNTRYLRDWAEKLTQMPLAKSCTFLNFTASHDGVGMRPLEGLVPADEIESMLTAMRDRGGYISTKTNSDGTTSPYELNISYFDAFRSSSSNDSQWHTPAFLASQVFSLSFKGIPAVYIHSLTATPNNNQGVELTGMTRTINRRKWDQGELLALIDNHESETGHVFKVYRDLLTTRRQQQAFHPDAEQKILPLPDSLFGLQRRATDGTQTIIALYNFSQAVVKLPLNKLPTDITTWQELLQLSVTRWEKDTLILPPYACFWFSQKN